MYIIIPNIHNNIYQFYKSIKNFNLDNNIYLQER
jgi:hypothetical protein